MERNGPAVKQVRAFTVCLSEVHLSLALIFILSLARKPGAVRSRNAFQLQDAEVVPVPATQQGASRAHTISPRAKEIQAHLPTLLCTTGPLLCLLEPHSVVPLPLQGGVGPWNYHPQEIRAILEKLN